MRLRADRRWRCSAGQTPRFSGLALDFSGPVLMCVSSIAPKIAAGHRGWRSLFGSAKFKTARIPAVVRSDEGRAWLRTASDVARVAPTGRACASDDVDLGRLALLLRSGACPEELVARRDAAVTVSTIHRAKGLEFDTVFVVQSDRPVDDADAVG